MFCIKIADIPIGIANRYSYVGWLCREYMIRDTAPEFTVSASEEEVLEEQNGNTEFSKGYCESLCLYRKICCRLSLYGAFLLHSAAVAVDGAAYVFAAPSGVGKSTHIKLWLECFGARAEVVNGDKPIFRFIEDKLFVCGTPWQGKENMGNNIMRPVQAVCFLEQSPKNHIQRLERKEIGDRIFHQLLIPKEEQEFNCFWPLLEKLLSAVDFYLLQCNKETDAAYLAYRTMRRM